MQITMSEPIRTQYDGWDCNEVQVTITSESGEMINYPFRSGTGLSPTPSLDRIKGSIYDDYGVTKNAAVEGEPTFKGVLTVLVEEYGTTVEEGYTAAERLMELYEFMKHLNTSEIQELEDAYEDMIY